VLRTAEHLPYEDALIQVLAQKGNVYEIRAATQGLLGGLELLVKMQYFAVKLGPCLRSSHQIENCMGGQTGSSMSLGLAWIAVKNRLGKGFIRRAE
jgi:hypothetical protein